MPVLMAAAAAASAASAAAGKKVFEYNRDNFMEDREQRMKKEFAERRFRLVQAGLWREDVRSFVSLTEKKMSLYLLVGVLLLSFNVNLWVEGRLPEETPEWLTMGMQIAIAVSFLFLLLSVWLAMHGAVAAQAYQTRVLTQMVRLPIPSWEELEACRTNASDFERLEPGQMFRVPFLFGVKQEDVAKETAALPTIAEGQDPVDAAMKLGADDTGQLGDEPATDPWGLERRGDDIYELGAHYGESVAKLRHIKLIRQAAVYWQTYDAFARVSMSVGTNQLLLSMSYYILGYALAQARAPLAAWAGVSILVFASFLLAQVDLTLSLWEKHLFHICLAFGPMVASLAVYRWSQHSVFAMEVANLLAPLAFISHGMVVGLMTLFVKVRTQENGAVVPLAFQKVLFTDVFGWVWHKHTQPDKLDADLVEAAEETPAMFSTLGGRRAAAPSRPQFAASRRTTRRSFRAPPSQSSSPGRRPQREVAEALGYYAEEYLQEPSPSFVRERSDSIEWDEASGSEASEGRGLGPRPAMQALAYDEGGQPLPMRPDDFKPLDHHDDMRLVDGAPRMWDQVNAIEPPGKGFWDAVSFMPAEDRNRRMMDDYLDNDQVRDDSSNFAYFTKDADIETGHDKEAPGLVPWRIFQQAAGITSLVWIFAGVYWMMRATHMFSGPWLDYLGVVDREGEGRGPLVDLGQLGTVAGLLLPEAAAMAAAWPYPSMAPQGLSCDAAGRHLLATDGLSVYHADLGAGVRPAAGPGAAGAGRDGVVALLARHRSSRPLKAPDQNLRLASSEGAAAAAATAPLVANFSAVSQCQSLQGQALQDAAIACGGNQSHCEVVVLHGHGRHVTSCLLAQSGGGGAADASGASFSAPVAQHWLRRGEGLAWLLMDPTCADLPAAPGAALQKGCISVGTTHGRVAQLQYSSESGNLSPQEIFETLKPYRGSPASRHPPEALRAVSSEFLGLLQSQGRDLRVVGMTRGADGSLVQGRLKLPGTEAAGSFCIGGGHLYMLGKGPGPSLLQLRMPPNFQREPEGKADKRHA